MHVEATAKAVEIVERAQGARSGSLTVTIGTGCCESTAPFLFEDFWPGPDQEVVGQVAGVPVYAPAYLRRLYPGAVIPEFDIAFPEAHVVELGYVSERGRCDLAEGLVLGAAEHYGEAVAVSQRTCVHRGDERCVIRVELS